MEASAAAGDKEEGRGGANPSGNLKQASSFGSVDDESEAFREQKKTASEMAHDAEEQSASPHGSVSAADGDDDLSRVRKEKRLAMNRVSARNRRKRKKVLIEALESQVAVLKTSNQRYQLSNESLLAKVRQLENELSTAHATIRQLTSVQGNLGGQHQHQHLPQHHPPPQNSPQFGITLIPGGIGNTQGGPAGLGTHMNSASNNPSAAVDYQRTEATVTQSDWDILRQQAQLQQFARFQQQGGAGAGLSMPVGGGGMTGNINSGNMSLGMSTGSGTARGGFGVSAGADEAVLHQQIFAAQQASRERTLNSMMSSSNMPNAGNSNTGMHPNLTLNTLAVPRPSTDFSFGDHNRLESEVVRGLPDALVAQQQQQLHHQHPQSADSLQLQLQQMPSQPLLNDQQLIDEFLRQQHQHELRKKSMG